MTREEQITFCRKCLYRTMDVKQGLICKLTGEKATFNDTCPDFKIDKSVKEILLDDEERLKATTLNQKLPPELFEKLKMEQRLIPGIVSGLIVGITGAILWGVITVRTGYQFSLTAVLIGLGVGISIRKIGNGIENIFGFFGAGISLLSVLFGNFLSIIGFIANAENIGYFETLMRFDYNFLPEVLAQTFDFKDLIFYGIAIFEGYRFSFRYITEKSLQEIKMGDK
jgi:hypothetical protein